jgi:hypothetical protein
MLKFTNKGHFFTIKKASQKNLHWKYKWWAYALVLHLYIVFLFHKKHQILKFWWYFKVPEANCFWIDLADYGNFGKFGQTLLHFWWLTSSPNLGWKLKNLITLKPWIQKLQGVACWKATIYMYCSKKFQKIHTHFFIYSNMLKTLKANFWPQKSYGS